MSITCQSQVCRFALLLCAPFADGQKIAKMLCMQISKETSKLRKLVMEYNLCAIELTVEMAFDPQNTLSITHSTPLSDNVIQTYLRKKRSEEEIELLEIEMKRVLEFLLQKDHLRCVCAELVQNTNQFSHGAHNVLSNMKLQVSHAIAVASKAFNTTSFHNNIVSEESECEEDIDSNSDTDDDMYSVV